MIQNCRALLLHLLECTFISELEQNIIGKKEELFYPISFTQLLAGLMLILEAKRNVLIFYDLKRNKIEFGLSYRFFEDFQTYCCRVLLFLFQNLSQFLMWHFLTSRF